MDAVKSSIPLTKRFRGDQLAKVGTDEYCWDTRIEHGPLTQFEYVFVLFSIVAGFTLTQLFGGLARTFQAPWRSIDPAHLLISLFVTIGLVVNWWSMYRHVNVDWTFPKFAIHVVLFATLYGISVVLFPPGRESIQRFEKIRTAIFSFLLVYTAVETIQVATMGSLVDPWYLPLIQVGLAIAYATGIALKSVNTDIAIGSVALLATVLWGLVPRFFV